MLPTTITWPMVTVIGMLLAGVSFLGYEHVVTGDLIGTIYGAVASGSIVGHFATTPNSGNA